MSLPIYIYIYIINVDTDTINNFTRVSFGSSMIKLEFINQPMQGKKFYSLMYGPKTQFENCTHTSQITGQFSGTNSLSLSLDYDVENTSICFILEANNNTRSVRVEGIHTPSSGNCS